MEEKVPKIGCKLLSLRTGADMQSTVKKLDSSSAAILSKVHEILVSCKEIKPSCGDDSGIAKPELCPKWIALLTMEKACLSTISLEGLFDISDDFFPVYIFLLSDDFFPMYIFLLFSMLLTLNFLSGLCPCRSIWYSEENWGQL